MTTHISARLAWHDSGWNGRICKAPKANTYCVGQYTYQKDLLAIRDVDWECSVYGQPCSELGKSPPCVHSVNAFGSSPIRAYGPPPEWFGDSTEVKTWMMAPATVSVWPYEEMYKDEVRNEEGQTPKYNPIARREEAQRFFEPLERDKSLIFYYVNYSNPFSEEGEHRYVVVGVSRIKAVGPELLWDNQSQRTKDRYGPNAWFRDVTSHYPEQGLRIPYQEYLAQPEILDRLLFVPDNSRDFKYATRHISDDGALALIERFSEVVGVLQEIGDKSENWEQRQEWLSSLLAELWRGRGLYPGLPAALHYLGFTTGVKFCIEQLRAGVLDTSLRAQLFGSVAKGVPIKGLQDQTYDAARRRWRYLTADQQMLLSETLVRFDLSGEQIAKVLEAPETASIEASHSDIVSNPFLLCEQYVGDGADDSITFSKIDHGVMPSPNLGEALVARDDPMRLRALLVDQLKRTSQHTFQRAQKVLDAVNRQLGSMPDWKKVSFSLRHLEVEKEALEPAITYRKAGDTLYLYRASVFEDERYIERTLRALLKRPDIELRHPVTVQTWRSLLTDPDSRVAQGYPDAYASVIEAQIESCQTVFLKPLIVLAGEAGTGKTTLVKAIIEAIQKGEGPGASVRLLAPTGKAADRLREKTGRDAQTIHAFLASHGWLNDNLTFKRCGGAREDSTATLIIDESSMLDLAMVATLFRAINWNTVRRLILVGDPNQLPPIGTGKLFADVIDWLKEESPSSFAELQNNMRQLENQLAGRGTGILDLARQFRRVALAEKKVADEALEEQGMLDKLLEGGEIDKDLRVVYWSDAEQLDELLVSLIVQDMETDTGASIDPDRPWELWKTYLSPNDKPRPERHQVLTPYRGELTGTEHLNQVVQLQRSGRLLEKKGALAGVTLFDKVIQVRNRTGRAQLWAWDARARRRSRVDVFNGEIGTVKPHGFDHLKWKGARFRLERFQVQFSRKEGIWVNYESDGEVEENLELAYAISVHKAQGSEFERTYMIVPKHRRALLSRELFYTGITRATKHCTLLIEEDVSPLLSLRRREMSYLARINSSLFVFRPLDDAMESLSGWYEEGKIHKALTGDMLRSKSEVIIANLLHARDIPFSYEMPLRAPDGTMKLPDFTIQWAGETWYWEHEGMLHDEKYRQKQKEKHEWYERHGFSNRLITTTEGPGFDSEVALATMEKHFPS